MLGGVERSVVVTVDNGGGGKEVVDVRMTGACGGGVERGFGVVTRRCRG